MFQKSFKIFLVVSCFLFLSGITFAQVRVEVIPPAPVQPATQIPLAITEEVLSTMNQTSGNTAQLLVNYQAGNQEETQSINKYLKQNTTSSGLTVGYYLKVLFSIALLSAILYLVTKFSKTIQKQKYTGEIKVTDRLPIDQHVALLIVTLNRQRYLLSLSNKSVTVLDKLEPKV